MQKAKHTTSDDIVLRELYENDWNAILNVGSKRDKILLHNLRESNNSPVNVTKAGYDGQYSRISQLNQKLRQCGETGYYLNRTDKNCWPETSLQIYVRKTR